MFCYILSFLFSVISSDLFLAEADHRAERLAPGSVQTGDVIFVKTHDLQKFFKMSHPQIKNPYILLSHITDESCPGPFAEFLDDPKLLGWFMMNYDGYIHPKIHPIPIGVAPSNLPFGDHNLLEQIAAQNLSKKHLLFLNFTIQTFSPERWGLFKQFAKEPYCFRTGKKSFVEYLIDLAQSKFVLAPRGAGLDTYRLWEALYVDTIPIVKTSSLDPLYEGLPILIVDDWSQVTEAFLQQKYIEMTQRNYNLEKLQPNYWKKLIDSCRMIPIEMQ